MRLQEALFLSSQRKAAYERGLPPDNTAHAFRCYRVQVEIKQKEYQDRFKIGPVQIDDVYVITVSRKEGETIYPPHLTYEAQYLGECLQHLEEWRVGEEYEHPWHPVEEWEPKPVEKQTDLAETILEWARLNKEEVQNMSVGSMAKKLEIFLIDVENLCREYMKDEPSNEE